MRIASVRWRLAVATLTVAAIGLAPARAMRVRLTPFVVEPQSERLTCEYVALPNRKPMDVKEIRIEGGRGLHHILLYAYQGKDRDPRYFTDGVHDGLACLSIGPPDLYGNFVGLTGAVRAGRYRMPAGYAVSLAAEQPLQVNTHVFDASKTKRLRSAVRVRFVPAKPGTVTHHLQPIDVVAYGFELPPGQTTVYTGDFVAPFDLNVAMVSSHQHRMSTDVTVRPIVGGVEQDVIYENRRWSEPPLRWLDPPLRLRKGDRLRMRCEWFNATDHVLRFGSSANDEMCNLNAYFFHDVEIPLEERRSIGGYLVPVVE